MLTKETNVFVSFSFDNKDESQVNRTLHDKEVKWLKVLISRKNNLGLAQIRHQVACDVVVALVEDKASLMGSKNGVGLHLSIEEQMTDQSLED